MVTTLTTLTLAEWTGILYDCVALHLSIFPRQLSVSTRHVTYRTIGTNKQGASIKEFVVLPGLSPFDIQTSLDRYATLVPNQYHDDFSILTLHLRNTWWKHKGSGGPKCFLSYGVEGVFKFSRRHNDKKRNQPTTIRFPPEELERLRLAARKLELDAEERHCQTLVRLEAFKDEQQEKRRQDTLRIRQEQLEAARSEAERLEAERLEVERLEAERLEAERLEAERLEAERIVVERLEAEQVEAEQVEAEQVEAEQVEAEQVEAGRMLSKEREKEEKRQNRELKRLQTLIKELKEKRPQEEEELLILQERLGAIRLEEQPILAEKQEKKERSQRVETVEKYLESLQGSVRPHHAKYKNVDAMRQMLQKKLRQYTNTPTITVHFVGSFESRLYCIRSDADFTVNNFVQPFPGRYPIEELAKALP
ncbi:MAG: hypothetical protein JOS17DRAFT_835392 [Linnemannia elongata]|nr:MAG: hypothetical protein JOS17DRAFT_835392 [Linnemannia elongata]